MAFINFYDYGRVYGGPEEGGWWFDEWECLGSVRIRGGITSARAAKALNQARRKHGFATDPQKMRRNERKDWLFSKISRQGCGSVRLCLETKRGTSGNNYSPYC